MRKCRMVYYITYTDFLQLLPEWPLQGLHSYIARLDLCSLQLTKPVWKYKHLIMYTDNTNLLDTTHLLCGSKSNFICIKGQTIKHILHTVVCRGCFLYFFINCIACYWTLRSLPSLHRHILRRWFHMWRVFFFVIIYSLSVFLFVPRK